MQVFYFICAAGFSPNVLKTSKVGVGRRSTWPVGQTTI